MSRKMRLLRSCKLGERQFTFKLSTGDYDIAEKPMT